MDLCTSTCGHKVRGDKRATYMLAPRPTHEGLGGPILMLNRLGPFHRESGPRGRSRYVPRHAVAAVLPAGPCVWRLPRIFARGFHIFSSSLLCNRMRRARHSHAPLPGIFERSPSPLYTAHPNLLNRRLGRPPLGSPRGPAGSPSERHAGCVRIGDFFLLQLDGNSHIQKKEEN